MPTETIRVSSDLEVSVEHIKPVGERGARFDVEADDGRKWRLDVTKSGNVDVVTTWRGGTLADLDVPDWMDFVTARLERAA